jgi:hypothetical protein
MSNSHARIHGDEFRPFESISGDFDLKIFSKRMRFRPLQSDLFKQLIEQFHLEIWFWDNDEDDKDNKRRDAPGLELVCFMPCHRDSVSLHVSSANLLEMLDGALLNDMEFIEFEQEIVALEKLLALCSRAIEFRREKIKERAAPTMEQASATD